MALYLPRLAPGRKVTLCYLEIVTASRTRHAVATLQT